MSDARAIVLVLAAAVVVFGGSLGNGFVWDDAVLIFGDHRSFTELLTTGFWAGATKLDAVQDFFRPVVSSAFWLQRALWGDAAFGFHAVSILLHAACSLLAHRWLLRRLGADAQLPALLAALLFVAHPSRVETVAWVSGSTDLWLAFWLLVGFEVLGARTRAATALAAVCWFLAALSKETGLLVPVLVAADATLLRASGTRRDFRLVGVASAIAAAAFLLRSLVVPAPALSSFASADAAQRVLASLGLYARSIVWPWQPTVTLGMPDPAQESAWLFPGWAIAVGAVTCSAFLALAIAARRSEKLRPVVADALWCAVPLLPVLNLLPLGYQTFVAERFLYLPLLGICALLGRALAALQRANTSSAYRIAGVALGLLVGASAVVSAHHTGRFFDDIELWRYEKAQHPDDARVAKWLAEAYRAAGRTAEAKGEVIAALDLAPAAWSVLRAELAVEWGVLEATSGPDAEQERLRAVRDLLDTLAAPPSERVQVRLGMRSFDLQIDEGARSRLASYEPLRDHRCLAHLRTLDFETAEQLASAAAEQTRAPAYALNHALVMVAAQKWTDAAASLQSALRTFPGDPQLARFADKLAGLQQSLARATPADSVALRAAFLVDAGAREAARRLVAAALADAPADARLVEAATDVDLADGMPALARARLEELLRVAPSERWSALVSRVAEYERVVGESGVAYRE